MTITKNICSFFSILFLIAASSTAFACGDEADGATTTMETLSLSHSSLLDINADFNEFKQQQLTAINAIAQDLELENFKITSGDISVNRSGQMLDKYDAYFHASLSFLPNDKAFTAFVNKMNLMSASQYTYQDTPCGG